MAIHIRICSVGRIFSKANGIRVHNEKERLGNWEAFNTLIRNECNSANLELQRTNFAEFVDWCNSDAELVVELSSIHFPAFRRIGETDMFIPCTDPSEHFFLDYFFSSEGKKTCWKICDMNSLKEWVKVVTEFSLTQTIYDPEKLALILEELDESIALAEKKKGVISLSY